MNTKANEFNNNMHYKNYVRLFDQARVLVSMTVFD